MDVELDILKNPNNMLIPVLMSKFNHKNKDGDEDSSCSGKDF